MTDPEDQFALTETEVRGVPCRVFANTPAHLAELFSALDTFADRELVVDEQRRFTYGHIRDAAARIAHHLIGQDIQAGDRVAIVLPNSAEWIACFIACVSIGAVPALVNARGAADEIRHCVESTSCKAWLSHERAEHVEVDEAVTHIQWRTISALMQGSERLALPAITRQHDDEAILMFTSGTTGRAKAAILTHLGVLTSLKSVQYSGVLIASDMAKKYGIPLEQLLEMRPPAVTLLMFPLFHVSGCHAVFLSNLTQGGKLVLMRRWDPTNALAVIEQESVTGFPAVPTMYWDLLKEAQASGAGLPGSLSNLSVGGQATPRALLDAVVTDFPQAVIGTGYGMTEANGAVSMAVGEAFLNKPHATGRPVPTIDVQIRDDSGSALPANGEGEIHVRGATLMAGYANADGPYFDDEGWFATGDIGYLDEQG